MKLNNYKKILFKFKKKLIYLVFVFVHNHHRTKQCLRQNIYFDLYLKFHRQKVLLLNLSLKFYLILFFKQFICIPP